MFATEPLSLMILLIALIYVRDCARKFKHVDQLRESLLSVCKIRCIFLKNCKKSYRKFTISKTGLKNFVDITCKIWYTYTFRQT